MPDPTGGIQPWDPSGLGEGLGDLGGQGVAFLEDMLAQLQQALASAALIGQRSQIAEAINKVQQYLVQAQAQATAAVGTVGQGVQDAFASAAPVLGAGSSAVSALAPSISGGLDLSQIEATAGAGGRPPNVQPGPNPAQPSPGATGQAAPDLGPSFDTGQLVPPASAFDEPAAPPAGPPPNMAGDPALLRQRANELFAMAATYRERAQKASTPGEAGDIMKMAFDLEKRAGELANAATSMDDRESGDDQLDNEAKRIANDIAQGRLSLDAAEGQFDKFLGAGQGFAGLAGQQQTRDEFLARYGASDAQVSALAGYGIPLGQAEFARYGGPATTAATNYYHQAASTFMPEFAGGRFATNSPQANFAAAGTAGDGIPSMAPNPAQLAMQANQIQSGNYEPNITASPVKGATSFDPHHDGRTDRTDIKVGQEGQPGLGATQATVAGIATGIQEPTGEFSLILQGDDGQEYRYRHLTPDVMKFQGQRVAAGTPLPAAAGKAAAQRSAYSTGPHVELTSTRPIDQIFAAASRAGGL